MHDASDATIKKVNELASLVQSLTQQLQSRDQTIALLIEQVRLLKHKHFGRTSEHLSPDQIALRFNEAEAARTSSTAPGETAQNPADEIAYTVTRRKPAADCCRPSCRGSW
ncbi:MAG: transposase domain-containing protein [Acidiferrobacterales bacterium]